MEAQSTKEKTDKRLIVDAAKPQNDRKRDAQPAKSYNPQIAQNNIEWVTKDNEININEGLLNRILLFKFILSVE